MSATNTKPALAKAYRTSEFIDRFANLAQNNQFQVSFGINATLGAYLSQSGIPAAYYGENAGILCTSTSLPGSYFATTENKTHYHGITQKNAYRRTFDNASFTFYVDHEYKQLYFLEAWMNYVNGGELQNSGQDNAYYRFSYPDDYKSNIFISKFNKDMNKNNLMTYEFRNAFPTNVSSVEVAYGAAQTLQVTCSFTYDRYIVNRKGQRRAQAPDRPPGGELERARPELGSFNDPNSPLSRAARDRSIDQPDTSLTNWLN